MSTDRLAHSSQVRLAELVASLSLATDLEKWLGYRFRENPLEAHPTIEALAEFLAGEVAKERAG